MTARVRTNSGGFTLIEVLVILSISVLMLLMVTSFFMTFIVGNAKAIFEQRLKREGETAINQMASMIRNSRTLVSTCSLGMTSLSFTGIDNLTTTLTGTNGRIASVSAITSPATTFYLTSDFNQLTPVDTITFNCYEAENNQIYIEIDFTLQRGSSTQNDQTTLIRQFKTGLNLRNN
jgi:type II secretory pathway pseudopilin PulG